MAATEPLNSFRRDNHYVPRTYLKHWGNADGRIWAYRVLVSHPKVPLWKHTSTKGFVYHEHLYTRAIATGLSDEFERWLDSNFESPAGLAIQKVVADAQLTPQDWSHLIRFLAAQDVRTPARLMETLRRWHQTLPELMENALKESVQELETSKREGKPLHRCNYFGAENLPIRVTTKLVPGEELGELKIETVVGRGLWLFSIKQLLTRTVNALLKHKWTILHSPEGVAWLTSDDPVVRLNFHNPTRYDFGGGWGSVGTEIFLPLSPRHMLYTKIGAKPPRRGTVISTEFATWLQRFTIEHAHRFVIAATPDACVSEFRPRIVDSTTFYAEAEQWRRWHDEQTVAESNLSQKPK